MVDKRNDVATLTVKERDVCKTTLDSLGPYF